MRLGCKRFLTPFVVLALFSTVDAGRDELLVSVAASLRTVMADVVERYGELYPATTISVNAAASGVLVSQIEHGAPVDLFVSASRAEIDHLEALGLVRRRLTIATGELVVVSAEGVAPPERFEEVVDERFGRIAIGNPSTVPAGRYAREALQALGVWSRVRPRLVLAANVRQVLDWVARGEVDAGVVYATDVATVGARVTAGPGAPAGSHGEIVYEGAVLETAGDAPLASHVLDFLTSETGREVLARRGFSPPPPE